MILHFSKKHLLLWLAAFIMLALLAAELIYGSVDIPAACVWDILLGGQEVEPSWRVIVLESRLPRALNACCSGAGLAMAGLLMQTLFRNPLAGPSVLGITSGASLGVAMLVLAASSGWFIISGLGIVAAAFAGSFAVMLLLLVVARSLKDNSALLIFGVMLGFFTSAIVSVLQFKANSDSLRAYVLWGMGSFAETDIQQSVALLAIVLLAAVSGLFLLRSLDAFLLGELYARSMGVRVGTMRLAIILLTGIITGMVTAYAGPIGFIGLVIPHLTRIVLGTSLHRSLWWLLILLGACAGLLSDLIARLAIVPLNAVTSALGVPVILYIIFKSARHKSII